jgi:hypothetical protein
VVTVVVILLIAWVLLAVAGEIWVIVAVVLAAVGKTLTENGTNSVPDLYLGPL